MNEVKTIKDLASLRDWAGRAHGKDRDSRMAEYREALAKFATDNNEDYHGIDEEVDLMRWRQGS